jgi:hypothetical protein
VLAGHAVGTARKVSWAAVGTAAAYWVGSANEAASEAVGV